MKNAIAWLITIGLVCAAQTSAFGQISSSGSDSPRGSTGDFGGSTSGGGGYVSSSSRGYNGTAYSGQYTVTAKLSELSSDKREITVAEPNLTVREGVVSQVAMNGFKAVNLGGGVSLLANGVKVSLPGAEAEEEMELGRRLTAKVTSIDSRRVRLDLRLQTRDLEAAEQSVRVRTSDVRAIETVELGSMVKIVLSKLDDGTDKSWLEVRVRPGVDNNVAGTTLPYPRGTGAAQRNGSRYDDSYNSPSIGSRDYRNR